MGEFYANTATLNQQSRALSDVSTAVQSIKNAVSGIGNGLGSIGLGGIAPSISALEALLAQYVSTIAAYSTTLANIALRYIQAESNIMGIPIFMNPNFYDSAATMAENAKDAAQRWASDKAANSWWGEFFGHGGGAGHAHGAGGDSPWEWSFGSENELYDASCAGEGEPRTWVDDCRKEWHSNPNFDNEFTQAETMHNLSVGVEANVHYWDASGQFDAGFVRGQGEVGFLNAGAGAQAYAGFMTADGKFAPGVGASAEASVSLFEASGELRQGNQYLGSYVKGEVEVCAASAEASVDIGLYDKDGNFCPSIGAGLEAEAILAQAKGSAGYTVMGTDVGVTGSIGFGAGAHAKVGFQNGHFTADVGAYVGVGASVSVDLDFNNTLSTIGDAWDAGTEFVSNAWDAGTEFVGNAWDAGTEFVSNAWDAGTEFVGNAASEAWDFITFWD